MLRKVKELFNLPSAPDSAMWEVPELDHPLIPKRNEDYQFLPEQVKMLMIWLAGVVGKNLYLTGPTGAGKSSVVEQFLNRVKMPCWRVGCHGRLEFHELVGRLTILPGNGGMGFVYGPLAEAMKYGGVLLLDETDLLHPSTAMGLNPILDGGALVIPQTGEAIEPHPSFRIAATGNSAGGGDETGLYRGVQRQNVAWMTRFFATLKVNYLPEATEKALLAKVAPKILPNFRESMVKMANDVRKLFLDQDTEVVISTRELLSWARLATAMNVMSDAKPLNDALDLVLLNRANAEDRAKVQGIWQRYAGQ